MKADMRVFPQLHNIVPFNCHVKKERFLHRLFISLFTIDWLSQKVIETVSVPPNAVFEKWYL
jgi:hypothetical protein